jgi:hypothetical protein
MSTKWYVVALVICVSAVFSCKDDDDNGPACSTAWSTELEDELNAVINAGTVWANDPSSDNCLEYKARYQAYINALRPYGNCSALTGQARADFDAALEAAEDDLETLCD